MTNGPSHDISELVAFHEPTRRRLIDYLAANGTSQVTTLAHALEAQVGSVSHHLRMLERAGFVERAPEHSTDGRTSWWRLVDKTWSWSVEDFDLPAERQQARAAQRLGTRHQAEMLNAWTRRQEGYDEQWRRSAFSTDLTTHATASELSDLLDRLDATLGDWQGSLTKEDGQEREPVHFFAYGFPFRVGG